MANPSLHNSHAILHCTRSRILASTLLAVPILASAASAQTLSSNSGDTSTVSYTGETQEVGEVSEDGALVLEEIVVRGELLERSLQDSPTSAVVERGETLERRGDRDLFDTVERTVNVNQTGGDEGISIRGVSQFGVARASSSPLISTQVDGIALPDTTAITRGQYPTWDVDQVEILRGPQSTQQGRNALGGAVVIRTRDPIYQDEYRFRTGFASRDAYEAAVSLNKVLVQDRVAFRFAAQTISEDGPVDNPTLVRDDFGEVRADSWRTKLRVNPTESLEVIFSYAEQENVIGETRIDNDLFPGQIVNMSELSTSNILDTETAGLRATYSFAPSLKLEFESSHYSDRLFEFIDSDRTSLETGFTTGTGEAEVFEQDIRLLFEGTGYRGVAGLFYAETEYQRRSRQEFEGVGLPINPFTGAQFGQLTTDGGSTNTSRNTAIFGEVELDADRWLPGLSFTLGARYDRDKVGLNSFATATTFGFDVLTPVDVSFAREFEAFLPKLGTTFEWREGLSTSLTYQRGYRAGGFAFNAVTGTASEFDEEFTDNIELAVRGEFLESRLVANANVFYTRWSDQQVRRDFTNSLGQSDFLIENAGKSELYGAEFSVSYDVAPSFNVYGSLGLLQAEYVDFIAGDSSNLSGNSLPNTPEATASIGASYGFGNGLSLGVDATYTGSTFTNAENTLSTDDALLVNAQLNYIDGPFSAGLYVRNIFDEEYATTRLDQAGTTFAKSGEPLTIGAFVQYEF
ncbi:TonB-dependent receptor [Epibacterium sp. SM1979]|uniref:TonB-dependent receptor n=1 Tax=Tritonibacter litoralis TaxID=2662264 RepID=A0A843YFA8_9RHOB|nr:TonB-dependent receptor [Tritonibacter litoralis]MQQ07779.1 TonB-dependent receptor [Tritonibacter litoralis]